MYSYDPGAGHGLAHDPLKTIIGPRPIGWIGTRSAQGVRNLAPYSFFNVVNDTPPVLMFCSSGYKDSVANIEATGCFTWSLVTRDLAVAMNATSAPVPAAIDEFELAGLAARPGEVV
ncbi:flavin reductase family protein, partial [Endobacter medicaginis]